MIDDVRPRTPTGAFPAKAVVGEAVRVSADVFRDGHDLLAARVTWRPCENGKPRHGPMTDLGNDRWEAVIEPGQLGRHELVVEAWTDHFATWRHGVQVKHAAGQSIALELSEGAAILSRRADHVPRPDRPVLRQAAAVLADTSAATDDRLAAGLDPTLAAALAAVPDPIDLTRSPPAPLWVDRERGQVGAWYELFPRSEGGLRLATTGRLPAVAAMGLVWGLSTRKMRTPWPIQKSTISLHADHSCSRAPGGSGQKLIG